VAGAAGVARAGATLDVTVGTSIVADRSPQRSGPARADARLRHRVPRRTPRRRRMAGRRRASGNAEDLPSSWAGAWATRHRTATAPARADGLTTRSGPARQFGSTRVSPGVTTLAARREYDEDDVRVRPGRSSRPVRRTRPSHGDAVNGLVTAVHRGPLPPGRRQQSSDAAPGSWAAVGRVRQVELVGDTSGQDGSLARIVARRERRSVLRRTADRP